MTRRVFSISDRTGITSDTLAHSLLTQFDQIEFEKTAFRFVDTVEKAQAVVAAINRAGDETGSRPLVFSTLINSELRDIVTRANCLYIDFFEAFIEPLERELGVASAHAAGRSHGLEYEHSYNQRIDAVNFAMQNDDGASTRQYDKAQVILTGVSRSGKTPTCLYLALHYSIYAANYPLTEEDLPNLALPKPLQPYLDKLFGLTIRPERLRQIRQQRRPDSRYASLDQCQMEVRQVELLYRSLGVPHVDTTTMSVEEIATTVVDTIGRRGEARP